MIDVFPLLRFLLIEQGYNPNQGYTPTTVWGYPKKVVISYFPIATEYWKLLQDINPAYPDSNKGLKCALSGIEVIEHFLSSKQR